MNIDIHTIKQTDCIIWPSVEEVMTLDARRKRACTLEALAEELKIRERELCKEQAKSVPNSARIAKLNSITENIRHTLMNAKRQK